MNHNIKAKPNRILMLLCLCVLFFSISMRAQVTLVGPNSATVGDSITVSLSSSAGTDTQWWLAGSGQATIFGSNDNAIRLIMTGSGTVTVHARVLDDTVLIGEDDHPIAVSGGVPNTPGNPTVVSNTCSAPVLQRTGFSSETGDTWYWQGKTSNGTHTNKGSASTYTVDEGNGTYYIRARSTTGEWSPNSGSVTVTANDLNAGTISGTQTICYGSDPSNLASTSTASDGDGYAYQWQVSTNNSSWTDVSGETGTSYDPSTNLTSDRWYRRGVASCNNETVYTSTVKVTVRDPLEAGSLDPVITICYNGDPPELTNATSPSNGNGSYGYQWQISTDNSNWNDIAGATQSTYNPPSGLIAPTWYRKEVTSCGQIDETDGILVDVYDPLSAGDIQGDQTLCYGEDPGPITNLTSPIGGKNDYTYSWQSSPNGQAPWTTIAGETLEDYTPNANATTTLYYRRGVNSCNYILYSDSSVMVEVRDEVQDPVGPQAVEVCSGDSAVLALSLGNNSDTIRWYTTLTGGTPIHTGAGFATPVLTSPTSYYAESYNTVTTCVAQSRILVQVTVNPIPGLASGNDISRCGTGTVTLNAVPGSNADEIRWYTTATGGSPLVSGVSVNTLSYTTSISTTTTFYAESYNSSTQCFVGSRKAIEAQVSTTLPWYADTDDDGFGDANSSLQDCDQPNNYVSNSEDLDDSDPLITNIAPSTFYQDSDGDTFGNPDETKYQSSQPSGYVLDSSDCNDSDELINPDTVWYDDNDDSDGLGNTSIPLVQCEQPQGYVLNASDSCPGLYDPSNACIPESSDPESHNYVYTRIYQSEVGSVPTNKFENDNDYIQQITYFDGLGRPKQQNAIMQSPDQMDIITHIDYDDFGRPVNEWLPLYEPVGTPGDFRIDDLKSATRDYYKLTFGDDFINLTGTSINAYSQKEFESSPLNRVLRQAAPGEDWRMDGGHEISFDYEVNTSQDGVKQFRVTTAFADHTYAPTLVPTSDYLEGELYKNITYDENHDGSSSKLHTTEEFTDKQGRVVLKRTYADLGASQEVAHETYYVYGDYGNLTYVLPPLVDTSATIDQTVLDNLSYQYVYDHRNRLVEKQLPGKEREYIVYNKLDQPIMTQDALQRTTGEWLFTKYDVFGRVAYTGKAVEMDGATPVSRIDVQDNANNSSIQWEERGSGFTMDNMSVEYDNTAYPAGSKVAQVLTVNYYDDYNFGRANEGTAPTDVFSVSVDDRTKGLATGSKVKVLDPNATQGQETWITTITRYDAKGRPIYTYSQNDFLQTTDVVESLLDFAGKPIKVRSQHTRNGDTVATLDNFTYDHIGRLLSQTQCIGDETLGENCANIIYDDILVLDQATYTTNQTATDRIEVKATNNPVTLSGTLTLQVDPAANSGGGVSADEELIVYNDYDELGQLKAKKVGGTPNSSYALTTGLQTVDYTYNVRGWLKSINDVTDTTPDKLFNFNIVYNGGNAPLYNGNIARTQWRTDNGDTNLKQYDYSYDALNRINAAVNNVGTDRYGLSGVTYDKNGNIQTLVRNGHVVESPNPNTSSDFGVMDNLTYAYMGNQLTQVADGSNVDYGFKDSTVDDVDYAYDDNGNLTRDDNKNITDIDYNHLNLPTNIDINSGTITYIYDATGVKLKKVAQQGSTTTVTEYAGNHIYAGDENITQLEFFSNPEGYTSRDGQGGYDYVYQYKDHLGNIRLSFVDNNGTTEIVEENNYYPFGLKHKGYNEGSSPLGNDVANRWKYQQQELNESLDYNMYEFELRHYDASIGRFVTTDPYEQFHSPYLAMGNNPVVSFDPDGGNCIDVNGNPIACPDGDLYNDYRDNDENHITILDGAGGVAEDNTEGNGKRVEAIKKQSLVNFQEKFPPIQKLSGIEHSIAEIELNFFGHRNVEGKFGKYHVDANGNVLFGPYAGGVGPAIGLIGGSYNPKDLLRVAKLLDRGGLTKIGRALQKHGGRAGSKFSTPKGNPASINSQGERILTEILNNPASTTTTRHHARFGDIFEVVAPNGQGARFSKDGKTFIGLIEK